MTDQPLDDAELRALAQRVGVEPAARLDVEKTAAAVVRRLRDQQPPVARPRPRWIWMSAAAAVALLLGAGFVWRRGQHTERPAPEVASAAGGFDLSTLSPDQLRDLLNTLDQPFEIQPADSSDAGLDDLTPSELRALLGALEG